MTRSGDRGTPTGQTSHHPAHAVGLHGRHDVPGALGHDGRGAWGTQGPRDGVMGLPPKLGGDFGGVLGQPPKFWG